MNTAVSFIEKNHISQKICQVDKYLFIFNVIYLWAPLKNVYKSTLTLKGVIPQITRYVITSDKG